MCVFSRYFVRNQKQATISQVELFINSVPILAPLTREERMRLVDALEECVYPPGSKVVEVSICRACMSAVSVHCVHIVYIFRILSYVYTYVHENPVA